MTRIPNKYILAISEERSSTFRYHLRYFGFGQPNYSGGDNLIALCGTKVGWDTRIPLTSWDTKDHLPSWWCPECEKLWDLKDEEQD